MAFFGPQPGQTWSQIAAHEERLQEILLSFLASDPRITVIGEPSPSKERRVPVISFTVRGLGSQQLVEAVEARSAFGFRSGHMYSHRLLAEVCGVADVDDGVVRLSFVHYTSGEFLFSALYSIVYSLFVRGGGAGGGGGAAGGAVYGIVVYVSMYVCVYIYRYPYIVLSTVFRNAHHIHHLTECSLLPCLPQANTNPT